jgi:hypothetical protein
VFFVLEFLSRNVKKYKSHWKMFCVFFLLYMLMKIVKVIRRLAGGDDTTVFQIYMSDSICRFIWLKTQ